MITERQQELIAIETIEVLYEQLKETIETVNAGQSDRYRDTLLDSLADDRFGGISLESWAHGLNTSLGQSFFENVAHILCGGTKKDFTASKESLLQLSPSQRRKIADVITDLSNGTSDPDSLIGDEEASDALEALQASTGFTADIFFVDGDQVVCVELKTVKPNKGVFKVEKQKILEAEAALRRSYPGKKVKFYIGLPFDPLSAEPTGYDKQRFMDYSVDFRRYFSERDFLLSAELWDFLSGTPRTMETILEIINSIATADFEENFDFLRDANNADVDNSRYVELLNRWFLFRELALTQNRQAVRSKIAGDNRMLRIFNQDVFLIKREGEKYKVEYNQDRSIVLSDLLSE